MTDAVVPVYGQEEDDEPRGGDEGVADNNIPESEIIDIGVTLMTFLQHHYFCEVPNSKEQVKHVRHGESSEEEECWATEAWACHDGNISP